MRRKPAGLAPVLLQTPPFHRQVPILGVTDRTWQSIRPSSDDPAAHPVARALVRGRLGGRFWADDRPDIATGVTLVLAPSDPGLAAALWRSSRRAEAVGRLVLVVPHRRPGFAALVWQARRDGGGVVSADHAPHALLARAARLRIVEIDELSALALLHGLPVLRHSATGEVLQENPARALALLLDGTLYRDPFSGRTIQAEEAVALLDDWARVIAANRRVAVCAGMSLWKRRRIAELFARADRVGAPAFRRSAAAAVTRAVRPGREGAIAVWSSRAPAGLAARAEAAGVDVLRVEDGFIRSLGLGSDLLPPASVIVDGRGIYFDPGRPSDLEALLSEHPFDDALRARAGRLIDRLIAGGISKYAAGGPLPRIEGAQGRTVVLVPGQVADDLSVRLGGGDIRDNLSLLRRVRAACPEAFIVYRPHPDVDAGHRPGALDDATVLDLADTVSRGGGMAPLIGLVDEVHTLTSLAGFEALLREKRVVVYGQPFYSGWGLTEDRAPVARRQRVLDIEALAAATLILYPRYIDPSTRMPCGPETLIDRLGEQALWTPTILMRLRRLQGRIRRRLQSRQGRRRPPALVAIAGGADA